MAIQKALQPAGTVTVAASTTSANAALAGAGDSILITNPTNGVAFVKLGADNSVAAAVTDTPVLPGQVLLISGAQLFSWVAVILFTGATAGNVYVTRGEGTTAS